MSGRYGLRAYSINIDKTRCPGLTLNFGVRGSCGVSKAFEIEGLELFDINSLVPVHYLSKSSR